MPRWPTRIGCLILATLAAFTVLASAAAAQDGDSLTAEPLAQGEALSLDATLSHPVWARAAAHERFVAKLPVFGTAPPQATKVQVAYDDHAVWVAVTAFETEPRRIRRPLVRRDEVNRTQDFVVVYLDAIGLKQSAQWFRVNAAGSLADGLHTAADDSEDFAPDFDWDAAVAHHDRGWTALLRIPFASLRFAEGNGRPWRFMVARRIPRESFHLVASVPIPDDASSFIANLQPLAGIRLPERHAFWTLRPSLTVSSSRRPDGSRRERAEASLDAKWRPRAELVIDGTLNPDFSQIELDVPQLAGNTRFALFLTEKRPFFYESADLLRAPIENAFYTRSFTRPRAGLRATWRGSDLAGSAFAIDDRGGGLVLLPGPYGTGVAEQPASRTVALRAKHASDDALTLGGIALARRYAGGRGDNDVIGPDVVAALPAGWRLRAQWLQSRTSALPDAATGALVRQAPQDGRRVHLDLQRNTGLAETRLQLDEGDAGFRQDTGFVNQAGVRRAQLFQSVGWRDLKWLSALFVNVEAIETRHRESGELVQQILRLPGFWAEGAHNLQARLEFFPRSAARLAPGGPLLRERFVSGGLTVTPALWMPLLDVSADVGRFIDIDGGVVRRGARVNASARMRPLPSLEVEPRINLAWLDGDKSAGGGRAYDESALRWLAIWHLDARRTLRLIVQQSRLERRDAAGAPLADETGRVASLTYGWRVSTGSVFYLGATRERRGTARAASEAFVKLQVDIDEAREALARR